MFWSQSFQGENRKWEQGNPQTLTFWQILWCPVGLSWSEAATFPSARFRTGPSLYHHLRTRDLVEQDVFDTSDILANLADAVQNDLKALDGEADGWTACLGRRFPRKALYGIAHCATTTITSWQLTPIFLWFFGELWCCNPGSGLRAGVLESSSPGEAWWRGVTSNGRPGPEGQEPPLDLLQQLTHLMSCAGPKCLLFPSKSCTRSTTTK